MSLLTFAKKIAGRQERQAAPQKKARGKKGAAHKTATAAASLAHAHGINLQPWVTEKSTDAGAAHNVVVFRVRERASKGQIAAAVQEQYGILPVRIRTLGMMGKTRRRGRTIGVTAAWKKAYVTLPEGKTIDLSL